MTDPKMPVVNGDFDGNYTQQLKRLQAIIEQWQQNKRSAEQQCATATEELSTTVQAVSPDSATAVRRLRELAQKLRQNGMESFSDNKP
jgi:hypothetical protein